jgi:hypothetical protein
MNYEMPIMPIQASPLYHQPIFNPNETRMWGMGPWGMGPWGMGGFGFRPWGFGGFGMGFPFFGVPFI